MEAGQLASQRVLQHEAFSGKAMILPAYVRPVQGVSCSMLPVHPAESSNVNVQSG